MLSLATITVLPLTHLTRENYKLAANYGSMRLGVVRWLKRFWTLSKLKGFWNIASCVGGRRRWGMIGSQIQRWLSKHRVLFNSVSAALHVNSSRSVLINLNTKSLKIIKSCNLLLPHHSFWPALHARIMDCRLKRIRSIFSIACWDVCNHIKETLLCHNITPRRHDMICSPRVQWQSGSHHVSPSAYWVLNKDCSFAKLFWDEDGFKLLHLPASL